MTDAHNGQIGRETSASKAKRRKGQPLPSVRRMHFNRDGQPKARLGPDGAAAARARGQHTYSCPICGGVHCGGAA